MSSPKRQRIRIAVDVATQGTLINLVSGGIPVLTRGTDVQMELAFFSNGVLLDISGWATVTANFKDVHSLHGVNLAQGVVGTASLLPEGTAAWNSSLVLDDWNSGVSQHCIIVLTASDTNISFSGENQYLWISLLATSNFNGATNFSIGLSYSGGGSVTVSGLTIGASYLWTKGTNDTSCVVDGSTTLTSTGQFYATSTSVTLHGTSSLAVSGSIVEQYSTSQQIGYGQSQMIDSGVALPPPTTVVVPTYLTVAAGDARYPNASTLAALTSAVAALQALQQRPAAYTGATDPNTAMLAGKAGDSFALIVGGTYVKTMIKTTGTYASPTTGGWA